MIKWHFLPQTRIDFASDQIVSIIFILNFFRKIKYFFEDQDFKSLINEKYFLKIINGG